VAVGTDGAAASGDANAGAAGADGGSNNGVGMGGSVRSSTDKCQDRKNEKWIRRCRPERNMIELGLFGGIQFPASNTHELFDAVQQQQMNDMFWRPYRKVERRDRSALRVVSAELPRR
jgi:hypothetical protein